MKFILNGCDIRFVAEAPEDITLKQLLKQCDRIIPDWCACGICSVTNSANVDLKIMYNDIEKVDSNAPCTIKGVEQDDTI